MQYQGDNSWYNADILIFISEICASNIVAMPSISHKGNEMPESPIRKLVPYAEMAYKQNKKVYHLNIGQPDIKTPQIALDAVSQHGLDVLAYSR